MSGRRSVTPGRFVRSKTVRSPLPNEISFHTTRMALLQADIARLKELQQSWELYDCPDPYETVSFLSKTPLAKKSRRQRMCSVGASTSSRGPGSASKPVTPTHSSSKDPIQEPSLSGPPRISPRQSNASFETPPRRRRRRRPVRRRPRSAPRASFRKVSSYPILSAPSTSPNWDHLAPREDILGPPKMSPPRQRRRTPTKSNHIRRPLRGWKLDFQDESISRNSRRFDSEPLIRTRRRTSRKKRRKRNQRRPRPRPRVGVVSSTRTPPKKKQNRKPTTGSKRRRICLVASPPSGSRLSPAFRRWKLRNPEKLAQGKRFEGRTKEKVEEEGTAVDEAAVVVRREDDVDSAAEQEEADDAASSSSSPPRLDSPPPPPPTTPRLIDEIGPRTPPPSPRLPNAPRPSTPIEGLAEAIGQDIDASPPRPRRGKAFKLASRSVGDLSMMLSRPVPASGSSSSSTQRRRKVKRQRQRGLRRARSAPSLSSFSKTNRRGGRGRGSNSNIASFRRSKVDEFMEHIRQWDEWESNTIRLGRQAIANRKLKV